jgi:hypothetical protein
LIISPEVVAKKVFAPKPKSSLRPALVFLSVWGAQGAGVSHSSRVVRGEVGAVVARRPRHPDMS